MSAFAKTCRAFGKRRLDALTRIKSREDWQRLWPKQRHAYPFTWGDCWKAVAEFGVKDFAAELGFYLDVLGMTVNATWPDHAMIMTPDGAYTFTIYRAKRTSSELNLQFMIGNIREAVAALKRRGVVPVQDLKADWGEQSPMRTFKCKSPSGVVITLWGMVKSKRKAAKTRKST
jgi:catechol 2,3-dioxygenase-like lactoylglutathione lyase family enzyme